MAELTYAQRKKLAKKKSCYAVPEKAPGSGSYPLCNAQGKPDIGHGRNALSRAAQNASPSEEARIQRAVYRKFPELKPGRKNTSK
jgi:hypothetical protein